MDLYILDKNLDIVDLIDEYKSCLWCSRYYEAGEFELVVLPKKMQYLQIGNYIARRDDDTVMVIEKRQITADIDNGNLLTVAGRSVESILSRRIVWEQTTYNGKLSGFFEKILKQNITETTNEKRKIANFTIGNLIAGDSFTIQKQTSYDNIYDLFSEVCKNYGLGFNIRLNDSNFVFNLYSGTDRSYSQDVNPYMVFSNNFDNLGTSTFSENNENYYNTALVGGEGEGKDRTKVSTFAGSSEPAGIDRFEVFVDAKSLSTNSDEEISEKEYNEQLKQAGNETLAENTTVKDFDAEIITNIKNYEYGKDFFLGDIVQIISEYGQSYSARITEMDYNEDASGYSLAPTFEIII